LHPSRKLQSGKAVRVIGKLPASSARITLYRGAFGGCRSDGIGKGGSVSGRFPEVRRPALAGFAAVPVALVRIRIARAGRLAGWPWCRPSAGRFAR
jgi:hypothetical protein